MVELGLVLVFRVFELVGEALVLLEQLLVLALELVALA